MVSARARARSISVSTRRETRVHLCGAFERENKAKKEKKEKKAKKAKKAKKEKKDRKEKNEKKWKKEERTTLRGNSVGVIRDDVNSSLVFSTLEPVGFAVVVKLAR